MYEEILQKTGLSKNEAVVYETLLRQGELSAGMIANKSKIHRRNVYDILKKLVKKDLVFEVWHKTETQYKSADPSKLKEAVEAKEKNLAEVMPELEKIYKELSHDQDVYIYRGPEGRKNEMRDMLNTGGEVYFIGAKGAWLNETLRDSFAQFSKEANKKGLKFYILFEHIMEGKAEEFRVFLKSVEWKFLPREVSTSSDITIYSNKVGISSGVMLKSFDPLEDTFTVMVNKDIADSFRMWFQYLWESIK